MAYFVKDLAQRLATSYMWWKANKDAGSVEMKLALYKRALEDQYDVMSHLLEYLNAIQGQPLVEIPRLVGSGDLTRFG